MVFWKRPFLFNMDLQSKISGGRFFKKGLWLPRFMWCKYVVRFWWICHRKLVRKTQWFPAANWGKQHLDGRNLGSMLPRNLRSPVTSKSTNKKIGNFTSSRLLMPTIPMSFHLFINAVTLVLQPIYKPPFTIWKKTGGILGWNLHRSRPQTKPSLTVGTSPRTPCQRIHGFQRGIYWWNFKWIFFNSWIEGNHHHVKVMVYQKLGILFGCLVLCFVC